MQEALTDSMEFLEKQVFADYRIFEEVGEKYDEDATSYKDSMGSVQESIESLITVMNEVSDALKGVNSMVSESATGVSDIANKTSEVVIKTAKNSDYVNKCVENTDILKEKINQFKC